MQDGQQTKTICPSTMVPFGLAGSGLSITGHLACALARLAPASVAWNEVNLVFSPHHARPIL